MQTMSTIVLAAFIGMAGIPTVSLVRDMVAWRQRERLQQRTGTAATEWFMPALPAASTQDRRPPD
jgi:hypothetical protein